MKQRIGRRKQGLAGSDVRTPGEPVVAARTASGTTLRLVRPAHEPEATGGSESGSRTHPLAFAPRQSLPETRRATMNGAGGLSPPA